MPEVPECSGSWPWCLLHFSSLVHSCLGSCLRRCDWSSPIGTHEGQLSRPAHPYASTQQSLFAFRQQNPSGFRKEFWHQIKWNCGYYLWWRVTETGTALLSRSHIVIHPPLCRLKLLNRWCMTDLLLYKNVSSQVPWWPPPSTCCILALFTPQAALSPGSPTLLSRCWQPIISTAVCY